MRRLLRRVRSTRASFTVSVMSGGGKVTFSAPTGAALKADFSGPGNQSWFFY